MSLVGFDTSSTHWGPGTAMSLWFFRGDAVGTAEANCTTATSLAVPGAGCLKAATICGKMVKQ